MRDNLGRRLLKRVALWHFRGNLGLVRGLRRLRGDRPHLLGGACRRSARCCEAPSVRATVAVWHMPLLRRLFLGWQRRVNGFVLASSERRTRTFVFECTHFDRTTRRCDSYHSRPGICRDYPRVLLDQPVPELFPECGYRAIAPNAAAIVRAALERGASPEQERRLRAGLGIDPDDSTARGR
jgi:Fe-S-cluster containining protein